MKTFTAIVLCMALFATAFAQPATLPEFNDKPALYDSKTKKLVELEKSAYNTLAKAKGIFKAEGGFFLEGASSPVKLMKQDELKFIIKVNAGVDPSSIADLVKFEVRNDKRVFITTKAKATSTTTSFSKINYAVDKIKDGYYYLTVKNMEKGEYFFGTSEFMFAFSIE